MTKAIIKMYNNYEIVLKQLNEYHISKYNTELIRKGKKITRVNPVVNTVVNPVVNTREKRKVMITFNNEKRERNSSYRCECGKVLLWGGMELHLTTKRHQKIMLCQQIQPTQPIQQIQPTQPIQPIQAIQPIQPVKKIKKILKIVKKPTIEPL